MTELQRPVDFIPIPHQPGSPEKGKGRAEILEYLENDSVKLHELNPLLHKVNFERAESIETIKQAIYKKIDQKGGALPEMLDMLLIQDPQEKTIVPRMVIKFEVQKLSERKIKALENIVKETYYSSPVRTRTDPQGHEVPTGNYPFIIMNEEVRSKTGGWYMGPDLSPTKPTHEGLLLYKDFGPINKKNFIKDDASVKKYIVEIRESSRYQTDLVTFATQVSQVLGGKKVEEKSQLLYESYYDLIRMGLKKTDPESVYGMDNQLNMIRRGLLTPLASPDLSQGLRVDPQSVLMVGVPGTGKTLIAEQLLNSETGLFILPLDPFELQKELVQDKDKQKMLMRIAEVAKMTGKKVILHIDDIENMAGDEKSTNSTMLNLMAGVAESGFHIIASTNKPEKIDIALLQPQRFGIVLHCDLQDEKARYEIAKIHATEKSENLSIELFPNADFRDLILHEVARKTKYFTPRYVAGIATIAKYNLMDRIRINKGSGIGLKEEDIKGFKFNLDDWENALRDVSSVYDWRSVKERDDELRAFVIKNTRRPLGFMTSNNSPDRIMSKEVFEKAAELEIALVKGKPSEIN